MSLRRKVETYPIAEIYVAEHGRESWDGEYFTGGEGYDEFSGEGGVFNDIDDKGDYVDPLTGETHDIGGHFLG